MSKYLNFSLLTQNTNFSISFYLVTEGRKICMACVTIRLVEISNEKLKYLTPELTEFRFGDYKGTTLKEFLYIPKRYLPK